MRFKVVSDIVGVEFFRGFESYEEALEAAQMQLITRHGVSVVSEEATWNSDSETPRWEDPHIDDVKAEKKACEVKDTAVLAEMAYIASRSTALPKSFRWLRARAEKNLGHNIH